MRVSNLAEVVIDMTGSGAPWLRAAARRYWVVPSSTPVQMARLARRLCGRVTGLVLSGGLARTLAHLGVLDVLHAESIAIDMCASCGYGALWSVLYAAEWTPQQIVDWVLREPSRLTPFGNRVSMRVMSHPGLFDARSARRLVQDTVAGLSFSDLETPCTLAACDLDTGEIVWHSEGSLFGALSACMAMPGLVTPVIGQDCALVDAVLTDPLPADALVTAGADVVLASSVIPMPGRRQGNAQPSPGDRDLVTSWLRFSEAIAHERSLDHLGAVDVLIAPDVAEFSETAFGQAERLIERGREAALRALPRIRSVLSQEG